MENNNVLPPDTANLPKNGRSKSVQLSSNTTLFWRVFLPIFGTVMITTFAGAFLLTDIEEMGLPIPALLARAVMVLLWLGWLYLVMRYLWRLKRVDADDQYVYVTNYWTTVRYPWSEVDRFETHRRFGRQVVRLYLRASGRFGPYISFFPGSSYADFKKKETGDRS